MMVWKFVFVAFAAYLIADSATLAQPTFPARPVRIITPNAAGGSSDVLARLLAHKLTEGWGQQVVVDNRPGGNGLIGGELLARADADGYTLMVISPTHIITPLLIRAPYDPVKGFTPVATLGSTDFLLVLHPAVAANSVQELITLARSKPLNYASAGGGSPAHLANAMFNLIAGVKMQHIPYKGGGPALTAVMGGEVQLYFAIPIATLPHVKSGRLKAIAIGSQNRLPSLPDVPTFAESGLAAFDIRIWYGVIAPPATPQRLTEKLSSDIGRYLDTAEFRKRLSADAMSMLLLDPARFTALMSADSAQYARVIKNANIRAD
jgi:tripartite-type tricarboxylate transporter receptor subunit TctC